MKFDLKLRGETGEYRDGLAWDDPGKIGLDLKL